MQIGLCNSPQDEKEETSAKFCTVKDAMKQAVMCKR